MKKTFNILLHFLDAEQLTVRLVRNGWKETGKDWTRKSLKPLTLTINCQKRVVGIIEGGESFETIDGTQYSEAELQELFFRCLFNDKWNELETLRVEKAHFQGVIKSLYETIERVKL